MILDAGGAGVTREQKSWGALAPGIGGRKSIRRTKTPSSMLPRRRR
jgi:hypothetical protein